MRICFHSVLCLALSLHVSAIAQDTTPYGRSKSTKSCADLLAILGRSVERDAKLDKLKISPSSIPSNGIYFCSTGEVVVRQVDKPNGGIRVLENHNAGDKALSDFIVQEAAAERRVTIAGDIPLDKLFQRVDALKLGDANRFLYFSITPNSPQAKAKQRLLDKSYTKVQIVVDVHADRADIQAALGTFVSGNPVPIVALTSVEFLSARDLPGTGTIADRIINNRPPPDALRFTVAHHSGGKAVFSDHSELSVTQLTQKRVRDGDMDVFAGCNLRPTDAHDWLLIDGELLGNEIHALAADISAQFRLRKILKGQEILAEAQRLSEPNSSGGSFGGQPPNGGDPPSGGGAGSHPPNDPGGRGNPPESASKPKRRFLRLLEIVGAISFADLADSTQAAEDDNDKDQNAGGTINAGFELSPASTLISAAGGWVQSPQEAKEIFQEVKPHILDRAVLYLDDRNERVLLFAPTRGMRYSLDKPIISIRLRDKPTDEQKRVLSEQATRFWFYAGKNHDPIDVRKRLLAWQESVGVTLPFIFIVEATRPTTASWTLLKPFLIKIDEIGEVLPRTQAEVNESGLFWCAAHETEAKMKRYQTLLQILDVDKQATALDLRAEVTEVMKNLSRLMLDGSKTARLVGVWQDQGLRRPAELIENNRWVDTHACNGRMAFVSAFPILFGTAFAA